MHSCASGMSLCAMVGSAKQDTGVNGRGVTNLFIWEVSPALIVLPFSLPGTPSIVHGKGGMRLELNPGVYKRY